MPRGFWRATFRHSVAYWGFEGSRICHSVAYWVPGGPFATQWQIMSTPCWTQFATQWHICPFRGSMRFDNFGYDSVCEAQCCVAMFAAACICCVFARCCRCCVVVLYVACVLFVGLRLHSHFESNVHSYLNLDINPPFEFGFQFD